MELMCNSPYRFRPVNNREALALIYTYEVPAGKALIDKIRIEYAPDLGDKRGRVGFNEKRKIRMRSDYNPENLRWLGVFIHESVHIWQANTWQHFGVGLTLQKKFWRQSYDYNEEQLTSVSLGLEQFPEAVEDWFLLNYGLESCLIGKTNQISVTRVWRNFTDVFKGEKYKLNSSRGLRYLQRLVNPKYERLLKKIRNPDPPRGKPLLGPDADFSLPPATQTGFRRVNQQEAMALVYTFGGEVGSELIGTIEVKKDAADLNSKTQILLPLNYNPESLDSLGTFIHKAARLWQRRTGRYAEDGGGENYSQMELQSLNLTGPQHAKAVEDWFVVNYYFDYCQNQSGPNKITQNRALGPIATVMGFPHSNVKHSTVKSFVERHYAHLIAEIRDGDILRGNPFQLSLGLLATGA